MAKEQGEQAPVWKVWKWNSQRWVQVVVFGSLALAFAAAV